MLIRRVTVASPTCKTNDSNEQAAPIAASRQAHRSCLRWICFALPPGITPGSQILPSLDLFRPTAGLGLVSERRAIFGVVYGLEFLMIPSYCPVHIFVTAADSINVPLIGATDRVKFQRR